MIEKDRKAGMPEFLIQQEYYSVITVQHERLYFSREIQHLEENKRLIDGLILPNFPAYAFYDLGINDSTVVIFAQFNQLNNSIIIYYLEASNHPILYYINEAQRFCNKHYLRLHTAIACRMMAKIVIKPRLKVHKIFYRNWAKPHFVYPNHNTK